MDTLYKITIIILFLSHSIFPADFETLLIYQTVFQMSIALKIDCLQVLGNYTLKGWFSSAGGASNTTLLGFYAEGLAKLEVAREGHLEATDIDMRLDVTDFDVHLENPGTMGSVLQGLMNSLGSFVFDTMKPFIMSQINTNILRDANKSLRNYKKTFPNSLSPLDAAFSEGRKLVRKMGYDPFKMDDFQRTTGILGLDITHIWITGLSSFHRVGNITVSMENNTVCIEVHAGTQQLEGKCHWEVSMVGLVNTLGTLSFTIEYLEVSAKVNQSLDVRNRPNLEDLDVILGNFQLQFDGTGTLDYVVEAVVNILPNLFRQQIMLAVKEPLKIKVQEIFNDIDVEQMIMDNVEKLDNVEGDGRAKEDVSEYPPPEEGLTVPESQLDESIF